MNTVKAWVDEYIEQVGTKKSADDIILIIKNEKDKVIYEGHFLDVPETLYPFEVTENSRCIVSSDKKRVGAYIFKVKYDFMNKRRKEYADELKERAEKGFIEKSDVLDGLIDLMEHGDGDIKMGTSGSGKSFSATHHDLIIKNQDENRTKAVTNAISNRILNLCYEYGYSINFLSQLSGITQSTVNDIVSCKSKNVGIITIKKICEGFSITLEEFFSCSLFKEL